MGYLKLLLACVSICGVTAKIASAANPLAFDKLPEAAAATIRKAAGDRKITSVNEEKQGNTVSYAAIIPGTAGNRVLRVAADGTVLSEKEAISLSDIRDETGAELYEKMDEVVTREARKREAGLMKEVLRLKENGKTTYQIVLAVSKEGPLGPVESSWILTFDNRGKLIKSAAGKK